MIEWSLLTGCMTVKEMHCLYVLPKFCFFILKQNFILFIWLIQFGCFNGLYIFFIYYVHCPESLRDKGSYSIQM